MVPKNSTFSLGLWDKLSPQVRKRLMRFRRPAWLGTLRNTTPLSRAWGKDRGTPVDRYYIEQFLLAHRQDIRGKILEVGGRSYTDRFGSDLQSVDVLDNNPANPHATLIANLENPAGLASEAYNCMVFTQVLQFIYDLDGCLQQLHRALRPGGVLLATVPATSRIDNSLAEDSDLWRFTAAACRRLFGSVFGNEVLVESHGNVLSSIAFLAGMAREELSPRELDCNDALYPLVLGVRCVKQK